MMTFSLIVKLLLYKTIPTKNMKYKIGYLCHTDLG